MGGCEREIRRGRWEAKRGIKVLIIIIPFQIIIKKVRLDSHLDTVEVFRIERLRERVCVGVCVMESV